jgi:hypothetical protein
MSIRLWPLLLIAACSVDQNAYDNKLYTCDIASADTSACGAGYGCYGAVGQLGAPNFCAPTCTEDGPSTVCSQGSSLQKCQPSQTGQCPEGMNCIRTDLIEDQGVCLPMATCTENKDCKDPIRRECFSVEMSRTYVGRTDFKKDHEFCFQNGCGNSGEACQPGTVCLPNLLGPGAPDVCTPDCDAERRCPPNFICSTLFSAQDAHPYCIPGFLGFRCSSSLDCVLGTCEMPGMGPRTVCTESCNSDADCVGYNNTSFVLPATFVCQNNKCLSPTLTLLDFCQVGAMDCQTGEVCTRSFLDTLPQGTGICVGTCTPGGSCPPKGGFPQACVNLGATSGGAICVIGVFGVPCQAENNCIQSLHCLAPSPLVPAFKQCTVMCQSHMDCASNPAIGPDSYCFGVVLSGGAMVCETKGNAQTDCIDPVQCKSGVCNCPTGGCSTTNKGKCG